MGTETQRFENYVSIMHLLFPCGDRGIRIVSP
jgi:hypothetical protein